MTEPSLEKALSVASHSVNVLDLNDKQIDEKLEEFRGVNREVDEATNNIVGKFLQNEEDEEVNADSDTYTKLWALLGGPIPIILFACYAQF